MHLSHSGVATDLTDYRAADTGNKRKREITMKFEFNDCVAVINICLMKFLLGKLLSNQNTRDDYYIASRI